MWGDVEEKCIGSWHVSWKSSDTVQDIPGPTIVSSFSFIIPVLIPQILILVFFPHILVLFTPQTRLFYLSWFQHSLVHASRLWHEGLVLISSRLTKSGFVIHLRLLITQSHLEWSEGYGLKMRDNHCIMSQINKRGLKQTEAVDHLGARIHLVEAAD